MNKLNYERIVALNPTEYDKITNQEGQEVVLVEHPTEGDLAPVIAIIHEYKVAVSTGFFDTDDMVGHDNEPTEYTPVYMHGKADCAYMYGH